ncbi:hypothetical protein BSNK01_13170 [Bacillaceae bacterium]
MDTLWLSSKDVATELNLHVRTLRNWIDLFEDVLQVKKNTQGHYLIHSNSVPLLAEVKKRKESGVLSLKEIHKQMVDEGIIPMARARSGADEPRLEGESLESAGIAGETESAEQDELRRQIVQYHQEMMEKLQAIENNQDALRMQLRQMMFELELINQIYVKRQEKKKRVPWNPFKWFSKTATE